MKLKHRLEGNLGVSYGLGDRRATRIGASFVGGWPKGQAAVRVCCND
jgi:hypothetical protein